MPSCCASRSCSNVSNSDRLCAFFPLIGPVFCRPASASLRQAVDMTNMLLTETVSDIAHVLGDYRATPLIELPKLAERTNSGRVFAKGGERPLGNFKALGGTVAGLRALARAVGAARVEDLLSNRTGRTSLPRLICASDGNHGLAVAAAARRASAERLDLLAGGREPEPSRADRGAWGRDRLGFRNLR